MAMSWEFEAFHWDTFEDTLAIDVRIYEPGERCEPRIDVLGIDDDEADVMFTLTDADGDIKKTWRPEPMQVVALEAIIEQRSYVVRIHHGNETKKVLAKLDDAECFDLQRKKIALEDSNDGLI